MGSSSSTTEPTEEKPAETTEPAETAESEGIAAAPEFTSEELSEPAGSEEISNVAAYVVEEIVGK
jgi:hypothetical protein